MDIASLPRTTPSEIAEATYQAARARRPKMINGVPDPRATWRKTVDGALLGAFAAKAFSAHLDAAVSTEWRTRVGEMLLEDIDRRFPPADMAVLSRYGLTRQHETLLVENGGRHLERFPIPARSLPAIDYPRTYEPWIFSAIAPTQGAGRALAPAAAMTMFETIAEIRSRWRPDFEDATRWPALFEREHRRPPRWSEIEEVYPRIGAWLALQRGKA
jgi:hypothetical protein